MENMQIYNEVRQCPIIALRPINAGRLKGKSDINPMWRIKALTETFGPCGIGWYYTITKQWTEAGANGEISAFVNIELYVKADNEWSKPILGTGGSAFVAREKAGLYTSDECYKMALTDAISVACKALGFAADVYWAQDATKYSNTPYNVPSAPSEPPRQVVCRMCGKPITGAQNGGKTLSAADVAASTGGLCIPCWRETKNHGA